MNSSTDRVPVGRIGRPHGVNGEVTVVVISDDPLRFAPGAVLTTDVGDPAALTVISSRTHRDRGLIVAFEGCGDRDAAESLRGIVLTIPVSQRRSLQEGEYWVDDLIGLQAVDPSGEPLGEVTGVVFGPQDRLVVTARDGRLVEVPFVGAIVGDPVEGRLPLDPPSGLFGDAG